MVLYTNKNASNYRLITVDLNNVAEENWHTLIKVSSSDIGNALSLTLLCKAT